MSKVIFGNHSAVFYIVFLFGDVPDESEFLRTARSIWLTKDALKKQAMTNDLRN